MPDGGEPHMEMGETYSSGSTPIEAPMTAGVRAFADADVRARTARTERNVAL